MITSKSRTTYAHSNCFQKQKLFEDKTIVNQSERRENIEKKSSKNSNQMQQSIVVKTKLKEPFKDKQLTNSTKEYKVLINKQKRLKKDSKSISVHDNYKCVPNDSIINELSRSLSNVRYFDNQLEAKEKVKGVNYKDQHSKSNNTNNSYTKPLTGINNNKHCCSKQTFNELKSNQNEIEKNIDLYKTNDLVSINENKIKVLNWNTNMTNETNNSIANDIQDSYKTQQDLLKKRTDVVFKAHEVKGGTINNNTNTSTSNYQSNTNNYNSNNIKSEDLEYFCNEEERSCELTEEEKQMYGNREMKNHTKQRLLGKGGCGIVWLCECKDSNLQVAVKQVSKKGNSAHHYKIAKNEIQILTKLNEKEKCKQIVDIYTSFEDNQDIWFSLERGGKSLSSLIFKIKGEFLENERIYSVKKGLFLMNLLSGNLIQFKILIRSLLQAISFISSNGIVHSDFKPENILVEYEGNTDKDFRITSVKVIDFGSAFYATNPSSFNSNTPEYMCPEITELLELTSYHKEKAKFLYDLVDHPWVVDVWSLGITLLELVVSCPIWMSFKAKVIIQGKTLFKTGVFGTKGRDGTKIHQKQMNLSKGLHKILMQSLITDQQEKKLFEDFLSQMLNPEYKKRISPHEALNHPFLII